MMDLSQNVGSLLYTKDANQTMPMYKITITNEPFIVGSDCEENALEEILESIQDSSDKYKIEEIDASKIRIDETDR
jgi:hypothetical protein